MANSQLFKRIQSPSHCLSRLLLLEKHHLGLRPRGHKYTLPVCPNNLARRSFILRCVFHFLWWVRLIVSGMLNICVCHLFLFYKTDVNFVAKSVEVNNWSNTYHCYFSTSGALLRDPMTRALPMDTIGELYFWTPHVVFFGSSSSDSSVVVLAWMLTDTYRWCVDCVYIASLVYSSTRPAASSILHYNAWLYLLGGWGVHLCT